MYKYDSTSLVILHIDIVLSLVYNIGIVKVETPKTINQIFLRRYFTMSTEKTIKEFIQNLKALESQIKELQDEAEAIKDLIKEELTAEGIEEIFIADYKVIYRDIVQNRFDSTTFKKVHGDLYDAFTKQTTFKRLTIN